MPRKPKDYYATISGELRGNRHPFIEVLSTPDSRDIRVMIGIGSESQCIWLTQEQARAAIAMLTKASGYAASYSALPPCVCEERR